MAVWAGIKLASDFSGVSRDFTITILSFKMGLKLGDLNVKVFGYGIS